MTKSNIKMKNKYIYLSPVSLAQLIGQMHYICRGPGFRTLIIPLIHLKGRISNNSTAWPKNKVGYLIPNKS
jgi:hypothetical protein